jgi:endonuclease/exonuclease/phosphatase family metal-dependent hydrolase
MSGCSIWSSLLYSLVSWNIRYCSHRTRGITSTDTNLQMVAKALTTMDPLPDIIALQEIDTSGIRTAPARARRRRRGEPESQLDRLLACINAAIPDPENKYNCLFYPAHGHSGDSPAIYSTGLAILHSPRLKVVASNVEKPHEITHRRISRLSNVKQRRICAWARFLTDTGQQFNVFNTHLSLPAFFQRHEGPTGGRFGEASNQLAETSEVLSCMSGRRGQVPTLLVGDFNAVPGSRVYQQILRSGVLRDAQADRQGLTAKQMRAQPSAGFLRFRYRLDHIFAGNRVHFSDFQNTMPHGPMHPLKGVSDHVPLAGRFSLLN